MEAGHAAPRVFSTRVADTAITDVFHPVFAAWRINAAGRSAPTPIDGGKLVEINKR
jgi:hypothetical protein